MVYPNPVGKKSKIRYYVSQKGNVRITITDAMNQVQKVLLNNENHETGQHEIIFDGSSYASVTYYCTIETETVRKTKKLILSDSSDK